MSQRLAPVRRYALLLRSFVSRDIRTRYAGSLIGFFWTVVEPLTELVTYTFVFTVLLKVRFDESYGTWTNALFLFCGLIPWFAMAESLSRSTTAVRDHGHLIKKVAFPPSLLPGYIVLSETFSQLMRLVLLLAASLLLGHGLSWYALGVVVAVALQVAFALGLGMLLATAQVFFKDTQHLLKPALMIWMFITPIFYPARYFPQEFAPVLTLNPMSHLVGIYRELLLNHRLPHWGSVLIFAVSSLGMLGLGWLTFRRHAHRFPDMV